MTDEQQPIFLTVSLIGTPIVRRYELASEDDWGFLDGTLVWFLNNNGKYIYPLRNVSMLCQQTKDQRIDEENAAVTRAISQRESYT